MKNNQFSGPVFFEYFYFFYIFFDILKKEFGTFLTNYHQDLLPEFQKHSQQIEKFLNT